jgi:hypothetical protein
MDKMEKQSISARSEMDVTNPAIAAEILMASLGYSPIDDEYPIVYENDPWLPEFISDDENGNEETMDDEDEDDDQGDQNDPPLLLRDKPDSQTTIEKSD